MSMPAATASAPTVTTPFDSRRLDNLMDAAGVDLLLATSKHNVQYLLGGHRSFFFDYMDAMGMSRYLPVVVYAKGAPEKAAYIGHRLESHQKAVTPFWTPETQTVANGSVDAITKAIEHAKKLGLRPRRIGVERAFLPMDAGDLLRALFPDCEIVDALPLLARLRIVKSKAELDLLRQASDKVVDAMLAVIASSGEGATKRDIVEALRRAETERGLVFEYCLITMGAVRNRAPSDQAWKRGEILSLDSGGNYHGYIGDLCRMAILGEPDAELEDLLGEVETIQQAAFKAVAAGRMGGDIYAAAEAAMSPSRHRNHLHFIAHGMGLVSHEPPHLTNEGPVPYTDEDAHRPLEAGMVISIETTLGHPQRGFIKLEDTVAVTPSGFDMYGDRGRGWNRAGARQG